MFDEPPKKLGEGAHAAVYKCYKKTDIEKKAPFAVKVAREPDEERRLAH
jgi:predicted Ser/Thr protein kinase